MTSNQSCILRALLFVFFIIRFLTGPVSAESLAHMVSKSDAVVQAHVNQISRYVDEHIPEKWASYLKTENGRLKISEDGFIFADAIAVDLMV